MSELRQAICSAFQKYGYNRMGSPTWWFKFDIPYTTEQVRRELKKMEAEGLVVKEPSSRRGQAQWNLRADAPKPESQPCS